MLLQSLLPSASVGIEAGRWKGLVFWEVEVVQYAVLSALLGKIELKTIVILILASKLYR